MKRSSLMLALVLVTAAYAATASSLAAGEQDPWVSTARVGPVPPTTSMWIGSVATDGDTLVFGAPASGSSGKLIIYEQGPGGQWIEQQRIAPKNASISFLGTSVEIEGDTLVAGAPWTGENDDGRVFVYEQGPNGVWSKQATLAPHVGPDGWSSVFYGWSVDIDGDLVGVGSRKTVFSRGDAFLYERNATDAWRQVAHLAPENLSAPTGNFGKSVAVTGSTALVADPGSGGTGAVFVYTKADNGTWVHQDRVTSGDEKAEHFGTSLAVDGDRMVVGDNEGGSDSDRGAAYVLEESGPGNWTHKARLTPSDSTIENFGVAVDIEGERVLVGDPDATSTYDGAAYVFSTTEAGDWTQTGHLLPPDVSQDFGRTVELGGDRAVVFNPPIRISPPFGSAYVYERLDAPAAPGAPGG